MANLLTYFKMLTALINQCFISNIFEFKSSDRPIRSQQNLN